VLHIWIKPEGEALSTHVPTTRKGGPLKGTCTVPAVEIVMQLEGPMRIQWRNCKTASEFERILDWIRSDEDREGTFMLAGLAKLGEEVI
jgi:hypothetical protein